MPIEQPQGYSGQIGGADGTHDTRDSHLDSFACQHINTHNCIVFWGVYLLHLFILVHSLISLICPLKE